jgi:hypothetical protein
MASYLKEQPLPIGKRSADQLNQNVHSARSNQSQRKGQTDGKTLIRDVLHRAPEVRATVVRSSLIQTLQSLCELPDGFVVLNGVVLLLGDFGNHKAEMEVSLAGRHRKSPQKSNDIAGSGSKET